MLTTTYPRFRDSGNLSPTFCDVFLVFLIDHKKGYRERQVEPEVYRSALDPVTNRTRSLQTSIANLTLVHDMFFVSMLRNYASDPS